MKPARLQILLFFVVACALTACAPDFQSNPLVQEIRLDKNIHNLTYGYKQLYFQIEDSLGWAEIWNARDTFVQEGPHVKFRSDRIWYEMTESPTGYRSRQQYPGWKRRIDSIDQNTNIMLLLNNHRVKVDVPAADVVLGGDSIRIAIVHTTGPAFNWDFRDYEPQPDHILLTTPGNDTMPIAQDMGSIGPISRQTVFRVGQQEYVLRSIGDDYESITIERLEDGRGLALTAELDLTYKQAPVKDPGGKLTYVKRTPGKDLIIYFWGGFRGEERLFKLDSLYRAMPQGRRDAFDLVAISRFSYGDYINTIIEKNGLTIPMYAATEKTCLKLNCTSFLPYIIVIDGRGKIKSFYARSSVAEEMMTGKGRIDMR